LFYSTVFFHFAEQINDDDDDDGTSVADTKSPILAAIHQENPKSQISGLNCGYLTANISKTVTYTAYFNVPLGTITFLMIFFAVLDV